MDFGRVGRGEEGAGHHASYAAGFETAGGLQSFELEVDVARGLLLGVFIGAMRQVGLEWGLGQREEMYQPASLESATERIQGVDTQGLAGCSALDPILMSLFL